MKKEENIIYLDEKDLNDLNCTHYGDVAHRYGFKYTEDMFNQFNETIFIKENGIIYSIEQKMLHDVYPDYLKGEVIADISIYLDDGNKDSVSKTYTEEEVGMKLIEMLRWMKFCDDFSETFAKNWFQKNKK